jgi:hypothetical protein
MEMGCRRLVLESHSQDRLLGLRMSICTHVASLHSPFVVMELKLFMSSQIWCSERDMRTFGYIESVIHGTTQVRLRRQLCFTCAWQHVGRRSYPESPQSQVLEQRAGVNHQRQRKCLHPRENLIVYMRLATRHCIKGQIPTTVDFIKVRQLSEGICIAKGNIVDAMMSQSREA